MTTTVVLMRHAKAAQTEYIEDRERPLLAEGREIQRRMNRQLFIKGYTPDILYCSPFLRTKETAEIISDAFSIPVQEEEALGSYFNRDHILRLIPPSNENKTIYFVGHEPSLVDFASSLIGDYRIQMGLRHSGAFIIQFDDAIDFGIGTFIEYLEP